MLAVGNEAVIRDADALERLEERVDRAVALAADLLRLAVHRNGALEVDDHLAAEVVFLEQLVLLEVVRRVELDVLALKERVQLLGAHLAAERFAGALDLLAEIGAHLNRQHEAVLVADRGDGGVDAEIGRCARIARLEGRLLAELQLLDRILAHLVLEDLAGGVHREAVDKVDVARHLVLRHVRADKVLELFLARGLALLEDDARHDLLAVLLVRHADDLHVLDLRVRVEEVLDLLRVDILAAADDHILDAAGDLVVAVRQAARKVARVEPALAVDGRRRGLGHLVIALHDVVAAGDEFAVHIVGQVLVRLRVDDLALDAEHRGADRCDARLDGVGRLAHRAARGGLGLAVGDADLAHVHLLDDILHDLDRAGRAGHDAGAHVREIGLVKIGVLEHRDEHRRHAVERGDLLLVDAGEALARRERRDWRHRRAVRHRGRHREHHAEAVEHRHLNHQAVRRGEVHAVADGLAVVDDVVMREHDALREARRAGGVLHVADVVLLYAGAAGLHLAHRHAVGERERLLPGIAALLDAFGRDDVAQHRQALRLELSRHAGLELGAELFDDADVVAVLVAVDHDERMGIGLAEQVLRLVNLIGRIDGDEHRADLRRRPERDVPLRHVRGPDGHVVALLDAHRDQRAGEGIDVVTELLIGARIVELRVAEARLVRELLDHLVEHVREGQVDQRLLRPDVFAGAGAVLLQRRFGEALV